MEQDGGKRLTGLNGTMLEVLKTNKNKKNKKKQEKEENNTLSFSHLAKCALIILHVPNARPGPTQ